MFSFFKNKKSENIIETIKLELTKFKDLDSDKDIIASGLVESFVFKDGIVNIILEIDPKYGAEYEKLAANIEAKLLENKQISKVSIVLTAHQTAPKPEPVKVERPKPNTSSIRPKGIKRVIAVSSAKGGVGKSTIAFNLAIALKQKGLKVGLLDADIYGPSVPVFMGASGEKLSLDENDKLIPIERHGIKANSIGFIVDTDKALIWRGPMLSKTLTQLFMGTEWGELDFLIIDLPPGTGDVQLNLAQQARIDGVIIVSTPQEVALADVRRGIDMFQKAGVPIIGIIENMSLMIDENSGAEFDIYGKGGAQKTAANLGIDFLGSINFYKSINSAHDKGELIKQEILDKEFKPIIESL